MEETVILQENKLDILERQQRQRNIIIFGVQENEQNYDDLFGNILEICNKIEINDCSKLDVQAARRLGLNSDIIRTILVTLTTMGRKIEILRRRKHLENTGYYIKEDFPLKVREIRKELQAKVKEEIDKGNRAYTKYDKIVILPPRPN